MTSTFTKAPDYRIVLDGKDLTPKLSGRLVDLSLIDNRGFTADTLNITLDDSDGKLAFPRRGVSISVFLGWQGQPLVDKGSFVVDGVTHSGAPDKLTISAKSADLRSGLAEKKEKSWRGKTIAEMVQAIAAANDLPPRVSPTLAKEVVAHMDQTNESDVNLLARLAEEYNAIATVKKGMLLFMPLGEAQTATGIPFPTTTITRGSGDSHSFTIEERDTYTAVVAYYQDVQSAARGQVTIDDKGVKESAVRKTGEGAMAPSTESSKVLRATYPNKAKAELAAKAAWKRRLQGTGTLSLTLALARPDLFPELPVVVTGFKPEIDAETWLITEAAHKLSNSGFTTELKMERKP